MKSGRYELIGDWETSSAGQMAYATYNGKKYFLKKYCIIKKPELDGSTSEKVYAKRKKKYDEFKSNREQINKTLLEFTNLGGNTICPRHWYEDGRYFVEATEYIEGLIEYDAILALPLEDRLFIMRTAAGALRSIHDRNIVHSDLKISNVLATTIKTDKGENKVAKIIDFDKSYFEGHVMENELGGDVLYFSPELAYAMMTERAPEALAKLTTKSDIFSLGLIFHQYLAGEFPKCTGGEYCGDSLALGGSIEISGKIREPYLRQLIEAMLQKEPADRPTASAVVYTLKTKEYDSTGASLGTSTTTRHYTSTATRTTEVVVEKRPIPDRFCEPWAEHGIEFMSAEQLKRDGFIASEQIEKGGRKVYYFYKADGLWSEYDVKKLVFLGMCRKTTATEATPTMVNIAKGERVVDGNELWEPECKEYVIDKTFFGEFHIVDIRKIINTTGTKGYVLVRDTGAQEFCKFQKLCLLDLVKKK